MKGFQTIVSIITLTFACFTPAWSHAMPEAGCMACHMSTVEHSVKATLPSLKHKKKHSLHTAHKLP